VTTEIIWRILAAVGLGAAVGLEREVAGQPAGLRTNATVALGAALFGVVSTLGFDAYVHPRNDTNIQIDVTRVASQVVVGIGFLGAGLIFRQRGQVRNLTTAASLWVTSAIGLACGVGIIGAAFATTVVLVATLALLRPVRALVTRKIARARRNVQIRLVEGGDPDLFVSWVRQLPGLSVDAVEVGKSSGAFTVRASVTFDPGTETTVVFGRMAQRPEVDDLSLEVEQ
jgi:putative Mg2+ transporter-C (MgtC) family protein